jgi:hypothetical protein
MATTVLTNNGEEWAAERLAGVQGAGTNAASALDGHFIGWGTGAGVSAKGDTTLFTESADPGSTARAVGSVTVVGTGAAAKYQLTGTLSSTTGQTITNAGAFSSQSGGTNWLFIKGDFTGIPLVNGDSIAFTITVDPA